MAKYKIGDWFYDNKMAGSDYFWKVTNVRCDNRGIVYCVAFMLDTNKSLDFRHWGDLGCVEEHKLRPVIDATDLLRCKLSDAQIEYLEAQREIDKLKFNISALRHSLILLQKEKK